MSTFRRVFSSTVGTKLLIGLTGLLLFAYLLLHLAGNLIIFAGQDAFNQYSHALISNPLIAPIEIGLLLIFLLHIYKAIANYVRNQRARPIGYQKKEWAHHTSRKSVSSTTMIWTGLVILFFVLIHVSQFKYGAYYAIGNPPIRDLYRTEVDVFHSPVWVAFYVVCVILVGFHLRHGVSSAFQSLGLDQPAWTRFIRPAGKVIAVLVAGGFIAIALWAHFAGVPS